MTRAGVWRRVGRPAVQALGFGVGVALLVWCVRVVMSEENRGALENLRGASAWQVGLLMGLAAAGLALNGVVFWCTLRPVRRLRLSDVIATNALCTFLSYLPFKISIIARWMIHNRRDGVPTLTIGAWFAVIAGLMVLTVAPMGLMFVRPGGAGGWWWAVVLLAVLAANGAGWWAARFVGGERGLARLHRLGLPRSWSARSWFGRLHAGADMAGDWGAVLLAMAARIADVACFGLRFWIAAQVVGVTMGVRDAVVIGLAYFVAGVLSPFGSVGMREGGALGMAALAGVAAIEGQREALITAILLVSVVEAVVSLGGAGFAVAWLRADRLLLRRGGDAARASTYPPDPTDREVPKP
ncbi:MAG: flippase-like domain-containing protein [Phycisphaerales bacterium]|nr:flippase-like domain-containing protein [Planctomycetota bacterium]MCH8509233.1 flippase-like domain-containing protein [Phycisphaerales bacterium]